MDERQVYARRLRRWPCGATLDARPAGLPDAFRDAGDDAFGRGDLLRGSAGETRRWRWGVETNLRHLKQTMKMDVLRCKSEDGVLKELWSTRWCTT